MIIGFLSSLFVLLCIILGFLVFIQKGKGSMGLGSLQGASQMMFGGSGGQDIFQKITWVLGTLFMAGSLGLSMLKTYQHHTGSYGFKHHQQQ